jgi:hypothetical protein
MAQALRFTASTLISSIAGPERTAGKRAAPAMTRTKKLPMARFPDARLERRLLETDMLTTDQKETILRRAGVPVPAFPTRPLPVKGRDQPDGAKAPTNHLAEDAEKEAAAAEWVKAINALYVEYSAARAAKSLRDAEEARRLGVPRQASARSTA